MELRKRLKEAERKNLVDVAQQQLFQNEPESREALDYLVQTRGFKESVLKEFRIGYVPRHIRNDDGNRHELSGKIVYPIYNQYDELVAVSSRDWREGARQKFWHESFDKPFYLYGFNVAKEYIKKYRKVILVEGEHDAISMHQRGLKITCGILGSAPQVFQLALLLRYCDEIYTVFDRDKAGNLAREMANKIYNNFNMSMYEVKVYNVELPHAKDLGLTNDKDIDPDFFVKNYGAKRMMDLINETKQKENESCLVD